MNVICPAHKIAIDFIALMKCEDIIINIIYIYIYIYIYLIAGPSGRAV